MKRLLHVISGWRFKYVNNGQGINALRDIAKVDCIFIALRKHQLSNKIYPGIKFQIQKP